MSTKTRTRKNPQGSNSQQFHRYFVANGLQITYPGKKRKVPFFVLDHMQNLCAERSDQERTCGLLLEGTTAYTSDKFCIFPMSVPNGLNLQFIAQHFRNFSDNMDDSKSLWDPELSDYEVVARLLNFHGMPPLYAMKVVEQKQAGSERIGRVFVAECTFEESDDAIRVILENGTGKREVMLIRCMDCWKELDQKIKRTDPEGDE